MPKPSIPQGTRDFSPQEVRKRQHLLNTLKSIFELYGFLPLETPSFENLITLTGKYGEEGDRLIFKILNNGLHEKKEKEQLYEEWSKVLERAYSSPLITERALRYDLTIPFARYVVMHQNELAFPFRRYQMQPVWRADRPQKGRYREFLQCDADIVGSHSLVNEAELIAIYRAAFHEFKMPQVQVKINNRKVLAGMAEVAGIGESLAEMTIVLDKLDKIGWEGVTTEMGHRGFTQQTITAIKEFLDVIGPTEGKLNTYKQLLAGSETGIIGITEIEKTLAYHKAIAEEQWGSTLQVDISLARGLNYYTGIITEVTCGAVKMGSIGGGGRYDDLTGLFGLPNLSGVGISFGIDRIYDVMEELHLFPEETEQGTKLLIINFGGENELYALKVLKHIREKGIATELYPDCTKTDKQLKYANKRGIPFVALLGDNERNNNSITLKNFITGAQKSISLEEAISLLEN